MRKLPFLTIWSALLGHCPPSENSIKNALMSTRKCTLAHLCGSLRPMRGSTPVRIIASIARSHTCADHRVHCAVAHLCGLSRPMRGRTPVRIITSIARSHTCADHRVHFAVAHLCGSSRPLRGSTPVRIIASIAR